MQLTGGRFRAFDYDGKPLAYGKLYIYENDSTTLASVFADSDYTTPIANPIALDEYGFATIFLASGKYDLKLTNTDGAILWTVQGIIMGSEDTSGGGGTLPTATANDDGAMIWYSSSTGEWVLSSFKVNSNGIDMGGDKTIQNLAPTPPDDTCAVPKSYVDNIAMQISYELRFCIKGDAQVATKLVSALMAHAGTIQKVKIYADEAPDGNYIQVDVNKDGASIFNSDDNRPKIQSGDNAGESTAISYSGFLEGDRISIDIDSIGSTTAGGNDLLISILYKLT